MSPDPGSTFPAFKRVTLTDTYEVLDPIGVGGSSIVYKAYQKSVDRHVAVKVVRTPSHNAVATRRFENEARVIARLRHPNTIRLYDFGYGEDGELLIVTELLEGRSLGELLSQGPLPLERVLEMAGQIAGSLMEAHGAGVIHRDLKPENIFLDRIGDEDIVKVLDFGIARDARAANLTQPGMFVGSPVYMAPEQVSEDVVDHRADIYAFGVLLYHMIVGRPPFAAETSTELIAMHIALTPPEMRAMQMDEGEQLATIDMDALVFEMLAKDPAARPQTMIEVRARIRQIAKLLDTERHASSLGRSRTPDDFAYTMVPTPLELIEVERPEPAPRAELSLWDYLRTNRLALYGVAMILLGVLVTIFARFFVS